MADVLVLGCGLIGTSIGLALSQADQDVALHDQQPQSVAVAASRRAGRAWDGAETAALVIVAVPPATTGAVLAEAQRLSLAQTYTHVSSVQSLVQADVERLSCDLSLIVGGHPLAGREVSGPQAAEAALFVGRPWAICASGHSSQAAVAAVHELARACGAEPVEVAIDVHDRSVALLSHLPQVASSALAGLLEMLADPSLAAAQRVRFDLSGPGLVDSTRLAAGDPALWTEILAANAQHVAPPVRALAEALHTLAAQLEALAVQPQAGATGGTDAVLAALTAFLERGRRGRETVPVKRGRAAVDFATVGVDVDDRPGRLAALLMAAGEAGINVEDVHVEHVPGRPRGVIQLLVRSEAVDALSTSLADRGWRVHPTPDLRPVEQEG